MRDPRKIVMRISLGASVVMLSGKMLAFFLTHSAVILSDAAESVVHGFATGFAAIALWYSARPADANHPYGHGRIAFFSAGFEGSLVFVASLSVMYMGVHALIQGPQLRNLELGLAITGGLAGINLVLGTTLIRVGKKHNEIILVANGRHVLSDMWTSAAAIIGVGLVMITGFVWLDPVAAILVGAYIMTTGLRLMRESFAGLMDELDPEVANTLTSVLNDAVRQEQITGFHQLRCRKANKELWVDVHILVPDEMRTDEAHSRVTAVEDAIRSSFPSDHVHITSHVEPADHETAHPDEHMGFGDPLADAPT